MGRSLHNPCHRDGRSAELRGSARERLLDAAMSEFREKGYGATSLQAIATRAGLSKGAIYWNFKDKRDLFATLVRERLEAPARALMQITQRAPADTPTAALVGAGVAELVATQPDLLVLAVEQWRFAIRDESLRSELAERQQALSEAIGDTLRARHATLGAPLPYPPEALGMAIVALSFGLAMEALVRPQAQAPRVLGDVLDLLYEGLLHRAGHCGQAM
jgi:AcrR family transcriptional regulator